MNVSILNKTTFSSDHFPVVAEIQLSVSPATEPSANKIKLNWKKASTKALESYSRLCDKKCSKVLKMFNRQEINAQELYRKTVVAMDESAKICIPKFKNAQRKRHDIPLWRQRMATFRHNVEYWLNIQWLNGGPRACHTNITLNLRRAKRLYKQQLRSLKKEIYSNLADYTTHQNCFRNLFKKRKPPTPSVINGASKEMLPSMWRKHFKSVFNASETPYTGDLFNAIDEKSTNHPYDFQRFTPEEMRKAIGDIDTNKSYERHNHWKGLTSINHSAVHCLLYVLNNWGEQSIFSDNDVQWSESGLFDTVLTPIPKAGKKDYSDVSTWRPISIGTSENWLLEKMILGRLKPLLQTADCQFGYKSKHSTSHAIEIVRLLERNYDCHACLIDASSAFDRISWYRIRDQFFKRKIPLYLIKLSMKQLVFNRITICNTEFIYPRAGIKQGGVLSGNYFSACYDDLVEELKKNGSGVLVETGISKRLLLFVLIYADDVILFSRSPYGLRCLIQITLSFCSQYNDISFNATKSYIMRLGPTRKPAVSVCGLPTTECYKYLGVKIGRDAEPQRDAAAKLFCKTNIMLKQNKELHSCSRDVKNIVINAYGNVYSLETMTCVSSTLRNAHRYLTRAVHTDWAQYADLPGPNIRSRRLYTAYGIASLPEQHRKRRNVFLIKAESFDNRIIREVIGNIPRITV